MLVLKEQIDFLFVIIPRLTRSRELYVRGPCTTRHSQLRRTLPARCYGSQPDAPNNCTVCQQHYSCAATSSAVWQQKETEGRGSWCCVISVANSPEKLQSWQYFVHYANTLNVSVEWRFWQQKTHRNIKHKQNKTDRRSTRVSKTSFCIFEMVTKFQDTWVCVISFTPKRKQRYLRLHEIFFLKNFHTDCHENTING